jgi:hypothetical protein
MKLVLTHSSVDDESLLLLSLKTDCLVRKEAEYSDSASLLASLESLNNISHLAFLYKSDGNCDLPFFVSSPVSEYAFFSQEIVNLIHQLKIENASLVVDILSCNLNTPEFAESVNKIEAALNIDIRYSLDQTGNSPNGNWVMESDNVDIRDVYFTDAIAVWSGVLDFTLQSITVAGGLVNVVEYDTNHIYIGGTFTSINGITRNRIARFFKDGSIDASWDPNASGTVWAISIDSTHVYIAGEFTAFGPTGSTSRTRIARFVKSTGAIDTWAPAANSTVNSILVDTNYVYIGGAFTAIGVLRNYLGRFSRTTGAVDTTWATSGANGIVQTMTMDANYIYMGGNFTSIVGASRTRIARFVRNDTAALDTWAPSVSGNGANGISIVHSIVIDGSFVYIGGEFTTVQGGTRNNIARVAVSDGTLDTWAPTNINNRIWTIAVNSNHIYLGGWFTGSTNTNAYLLRYTKSTGVFDSTWTPSMVRYTGDASDVRSLKIDSDFMYLGGSFSGIQNISVDRFSLYNLSTSQLANAPLRGIKSPNWQGFVNAIAVDDTYTYIGGTFKSINNNPRNYLARYNRTTGELDSWNPSGTRYSVTAIAVNSTHIYVGGNLTLADNSSQCIVRYVKSTGELDTWVSGLGNNVTPSTLVIDGSSLYFGGTGLSSARLGRINLTNNTRDWSPLPDSNITSIVVTSSTIFVSGEFTTINSTNTRNRLASFNKSTLALESAFAAVNNTVNAIAVSGDNLYYTGSFTSPPGIGAMSISGRTVSWTPTTGVTGATCMAVDSTYLYVGGSFTTIGGSTRNRIARYTLSNQTVDSWDPNANTTVSALLTNSNSVFIGGQFVSLTNAAASLLVSNSSYITWTDTELVSSRVALTSRSLTIPTKTINQRDTVTDNFVNFASITGANIPIVRHALLNVLESINPKVTSYFMPRANLGLTGTGNVQVYLPYQRIDVTSVSSTNPVYVNLYQLNDTVTFSSGSTTKTITKTVTGYSLDGVTYADNDSANFLSNYTITFGGVYVTAGALQSAPDVPTSVSATAGNTQATVSWTAPVNNGNSAITSYTVTSSPGSITATGVSSPITITGLTAGISYTFTVVATNGIGSSSASAATSSVTPYTTPGAPTSVSATAGNAQATVSWAAPSSNGGSAIIDYTVTSNPSGIRMTSSSSPVTFTGLLTGTSYTFTVTARNIAGSSSASSASSAVIPYGAPGVPQSVTSLGGDQYVDIGFTAAANNGNAITLYTVSVSGKPDTTGTTSPIRVSGLTNDQQYTFSITATNAAGAGSAATILGVPVNPTTTSVNTSSISVSTSTQAAQVVQSVVNAPSSVVTEIALVVINQVKASSSISDVLTAAKNVNTSLSNNSLKQSVAKAAGKAAASSTMSTASTVTDKINDYKQRILDVKTASAADTDIAPLIQNTVQGAASSVLEVIEEFDINIIAIIIVGNSSSGPTRSSVKTATVTEVEDLKSGVTIPVAGDVLVELLASLPAECKTLDLEGVSDLKVLIADKITKSATLPVNGDAWYVPMIPGVEYTLGNSGGPETAKFVFDAANNTMIKDGTSFIHGTQFTINGVLYPTYALGSLTGGGGTIQPRPIEVNLNVEINANGTLEVLGYQPTTPSNLIIASNLLPVDALYDEAAGIALIEFWEPDNLDDIMTQLASTQIVGGVEGYKITAKKLALGLQSCLIGELDAKSAEPFNLAPRYGAEGVQNGNRVMTGFGRLALMAYAHYIMGHVQATAAITNDTGFMRGMLSLNSDTLTDYKYANIGNYDATVAPWSTAGSASDANLAVRLVKALIDNNPTASLISNGTATTVADIVKQVIGQDASRATDEDNNKYSPENHGLLRFYPDDVIYVSINLTTPTVTVGAGQLVSGPTMEDLYENATGDKKYTLKLTLGPKV